MSKMSHQTIDEIIHRVAKQLYKPTRLFDLEDLVQEGYLVYCKTKDEWRPDGGATPEGFLRLCVYRGVIKFLKKQRRYYRNEILDEEYYNSIDALWELHPDFDELDVKILEMKVDGYTYKEICEKLGISEYKTIKSWKKIINATKKSFSC